MPAPGAAGETSTQRRTFREVEVRPTALGGGSRALVRLVDELERAADVARPAAVRRAAEWPYPAREIGAATAGVLEAAGQALSAATPERSTALSRLDDALKELAEARVTVFAHAEAALSCGGAPLPPYEAHELSQAALMTGEVAAAPVTADARPLERLMVRDPTGRAPDRLSAPHRVIAGHLDRHSVWLHNSLRGGAGLSLAALIAELVERSPWPPSREESDRSSSARPVSPSRWCSRSTSSDPPAGRSASCGSLTWRSDVVPG